MSIIKPGALVVSCQAGRGNQVHPPEPMALMARAVEAGGADLVATTLSGYTNARLAGAIRRDSSETGHDR